MPFPFAAVVCAALALLGPLALASTVPALALAGSAGALILALPRGLRAAGVLVTLTQLARVHLADVRGGELGPRLRAEFAQARACTLRGVVSSAVVAREGLFAWELIVESASCEGAGPESLRSGAPVRVRFDEGSWRRGDRLEVSGSVAATRSIVAPWEPSMRIRDARGEPSLQLRAEGVLLLARAEGLFAFVDDARSELRRFFDTALEPASAKLLRALVLAEVDLDADTGRAFKRSGLSHVLAVSGMHLALVAGGAGIMARALFRRMPWIAARVPAHTLATAPALAAAVAYASLTGFGGSSLRALAMLAAHAVFVFARRRPSGSSSLAASSLAVAALDPLALADLSTALSIAATAALVLGGNALSSAIPGPRPLATAIGASLAATLGTAPVLTAFGLPIPFAGTLANLAAVPLGELVALPFALAASLFALCTLERAATLAVAIAAAGLSLVARVASFAASFPGLVVFLPLPSRFTTAAIVVGASVAFALRAPAARRLAALLALALAAAGETMTRFVIPDDSLRITHLDVGQGDSTVLEFPRGPLWLVDGGGLVASPIDVGERVVVPALVNARRSPDVVILTHPHPDHFGGLAAVLRDRPPRELWDTGQGEEEGVGGPYASLLADARARGIRVRRPRELCGTQRVGDAWVEVLAPCPGPTSDRGPNDNSFVFRVRFGEHAALFTGDAEAELEAELVARHRRAGLRADVLKVAHHGSRTSSTPPFLDAVSPSLAVVSAGHRNRFGHPHPRTIDALARRGIAVARTDLLGTLREESDGARWSRAPPPFSSSPFAGAW